MKTRQVIATVGISAATLVLLAGAFAAGTVSGHARVVTQTHTVTRVVHVRAKPKVIIRHRTRTITSGTVVTCYASGLGAVYPLAPGGAGSSAARVQCALSLYQGVPVSAGIFLRLTTVPTAQYPQPVSDSYSLVNTGRG